MVRTSLQPRERLAATRGARRTWLDDEPGLVTGLREGTSLLARGFSHWLLTLGSGFSLTLLVLGAVTVLRPDHSPRFVLRVQELDASPSAMPSPKRHFATYVREAVFTSKALTELMRRHRLYDRLLRKNPRAALDSFREDIKVDVYQNYFVEQRSAGEAPRSARVAVRYSSKDRAVALAVTRELGQLIVEHERAARRAQATRAEDAAVRAVESAKHAVAQRRSEVIDKRLEIARSEHPDPMNEVELVSLLGSLQLKERQLDEAQAQKTALELGAAYESHGVGMRFDVVDDGASPSSTRLGTSRLLLLAVGAFCVGMPLAAAAIGAFDRNRGEV